MFQHISCSGEACDDSQVGATWTFRLRLQPRSRHRSRSQEERPGVFSTRGHCSVKNSSGSEQKLTDDQTQTKIND